MPASDDPLYELDCSCFVDFRTSRKWLPLENDDSDSDTLTDSDVLGAICLDYFFMVPSGFFSFLSTLLRSGLALLSLRMLNFTSYSSFKSFEPSFETCMEEGEKIGYNANDCLLFVNLFPLADALRLDLRGLSLKFCFW